MLKIAVPKEPAFAPHLLAASWGWFEDEGIEVDNVWVPPGLSALDLLCEGRVDVIVGSMLFVLMGRDQDLACVGQANARCHHVLAGRPGTLRDDSAQLASPTILIPGHAPTPAVALAEGLRLSGRDLGQPRYVPFPNSAMVGRQFVEQGFGDLALLPLDVAREHNLETVLSLATSLGPLPWSVLIARRAQLPEIGAAMRAMLRVVERANRWLVDPSLVLTQERLPQKARWLAAHNEAIRTYARMGLWAASVDVDIDAAQRWADVLHAATIAPGVNVHDVVWSVGAK